MTAQQVSSQMTAAQWQATERMARDHGLGDAELFALAVGCPVHGNAGMDFDEGTHEVFCSRTHGSI